MSEKENRRQAKTVVMKMVRNENELFGMLFQLLYTGVFVVAFCYALFELFFSSNEVVRAISVATAVLSFGFLLITATIAGYLEEMEGQKEE